jgi:hypothetical protein
MLKSNRRKFMQQSAVMAVGSSLLLDASKDKKNNQFVHHVFFYLKENTAPNRDKLIEGLKKLTKIALIKSYNIGVPSVSDRDVVIKDYSISWLTYFKDSNAEKEYQKDPVHLKFVEEYAYLWKDVKVYDSEAVIFKMQ